MKREEDKKAPVLNDCAIKSLSTKVKCFLKMTLTAREHDWLLKKVHTGEIYGQVLKQCPVNNNDFTHCFKTLPEWHEPNSPVHPPRGSVETSGPDLTLYLTHFMRRTMTEIINLKFQHSSHSTRLAMLQQRVRVQIQGLSSELSIHADGREELPSEPQGFQKIRLSCCCVMYAEVAPRYRKACLDWCMLCWV